MALNLGFTYREQVGADGGGDTVATYLAEHYRHSTAEIWLTRIARGEVEVGGRRAEADQRLVAGQWLDWHRPPWAEADVPLAFGVVAEDAQVLVVDKPSGLPTIPGGGFLQNTLLFRVRELDPGWTPLHRLGRCTSGLVLFARGAESLAALSRDWRRGAVLKRYLAVASGRIEADRFEVQQPIGPVPYPALGTIHAASPQGRAARSTVEVLGRQDESSLCGVRIDTGRPHQIRIHLAFAGYPLLGDPLYGPGGLPLPGIDSLPGDGGYLLHAHRLSVRHPATNEEVHFIAPPPAPYRAAFPESAAEVG